MMVLIVFPSTSSLMNSASAKRYKTDLMQVEGDSQKISCNLAKNVVRDCLNTSMVESKSNRHAQ